jgi:hypothetical protein
VILAVLGLSMLTTLSTTQLSLMLSSATLFIASIVGLLHMILTKVKAADTDGHLGILGITLIEFVASAVMLLKYFPLLELSWSKIAAVAIFVPATFGLFIPLIRERLKTLF